MSTKLRLSPARPEHTCSLILSLVVNNHATDLDNIKEVTGCTLWAIKAAMPLVWEYAHNCSSMSEFNNIYALRKQLLTLTKEDQYAH